jgi:hypothetical protein
MKNILIADSDLGFVAWLCCALIGPNRQTWPACSVSDAMVLVVEPSTPIDVLIINPSMPKASKLIDLLRLCRPHLKVIGVGGRGKSKLPNIDVGRQKPSRSDQSAKEEWVEALKRSFARRSAA